MLTGWGPEFFDQSVRCLGTESSYQCDAKWDGSVIIERVSAHCSGYGGPVWVLKVITSISSSAPSTPAVKLSASPGPGATGAAAFEGARRYLPLTSVLSLDPMEANAHVTTLVPLSMRTLVPQDRFVRLIFEGEMTSARCVVAFSGRWLD